MKRLFAALLLLICFPAKADITNEHFSFSQVFDVQWYISGGVLHASSFNYLYASQPSNARLTSAQTAAYANAGDYLAFFHSTTNPGTYGLGVYDPNGNLVRVLDNTGTFTALANGAIFYNGAGMWGTLFTTLQGYAIGGSGSWTVTVSNPSNSYMQSYTPTNTQPLGTGQTYTPTPTYTSVITSAEQTRYNAAEARLNALSGDSIYISQSSGGGNIVSVIQNGKKESVDGINQQNAQIQGGGNIVTVNQGDPVALYGNNLIDLSVLGSSNTLNLNQGYDTNGNYTGTDMGGHYQYVSINGSANNVTTQQEGQSQYGEVNITGNNNTQIMVQTGFNHQLFSMINGNSNTINTMQTGTAGNFLDITLSGDGNSAIVNQSGTTQNRATISITNAGGPGSVNLTQTGGQVYSISTTCVTAGGCGTVTVRQGN